MIMRCIKNKGAFSKFICIINILGVSSCASGPTQQGSLGTLTVDHDAYVTSGTDETKKISAKTDIPWNGESTLIESPGYASVILVSTSSKDPSHIQIKLKPLSDWAGHMVRGFSNQIASELLSKAYQIQLDIGQGKTKSALESILTLRTKYPEISYLGFLEASCQASLGKKTEAVRALEFALADYTQNKDALDLYQILTGKPYQSIKRELSHEKKASR